MHVERCEHEWEPESAFTIFSAYQIQAQVNRTLVSKAKLLIVFVL